MRLAALYVILTAAGLAQAQTCPSGYTLANGTCKISQAVLAPAPAPATTPNTQYAPSSDTSGAYCFACPLGTATNVTNYSSSNVIFCDSEWDGSEAAPNCQWILYDQNAGGLAIMDQGSNEFIFSNGTFTAPNAVSAVSINASLSVTANTVTATSGAVTGAGFATSPKCSTSASPASCTSSAAGSVAIPTGTNPTLVIDTSAVTASSQILLTADQSNGAAGTCNSTAATLALHPYITARTAGTSFTVAVNGTVSTNPLCISYFIIN